jgi:hypothetical protein
MKLRDRNPHYWQRDVKSGILLLPSRSSLRCNRTTPMLA